MGLLTQMRAFIDVVDAEGFSAASRVNNRSKALLSKYVRKLEDELGVLLLNRTTRQFSLTEAGYKYYERAQNILKNIEDLGNSMATDNADASGRIKISASRTFADAPIGQSLIDFLTSYPAISLDIHLDDRFTDLIKEGFDLAIRLTALTDSSLIARKLCNLEGVVIGSPALIEKVGMPQIPSDLTSRPCLIDPNNRGFKNWEFKNLDGTQFFVAVDGPLEVNSPIMTRNAAISGVGFAHMPRFVAQEEIKNGKLISVLENYTVDNRGIYAVYPHRRYLSAKLRLLVDELAKWFKQY